MNSFLIKSFKGGISGFEDRGIAGSYKLSSGIDIHKTTDSLSCQQTLTGEGAVVITDLIRWFVPCTDGNCYGFSSGGKIYKRISAGTWTLVYTDVKGAITGACEWFLSTGKTYLFWTNSTYLNCKEIPGNTGWTDVNALAGYPKTTLTAATWHTLVQSVGTMQIANVDWLGEVAYDGSYTNQALNIFKKHVAKALIDKGSYVAVGAYRADNSPESDLIYWDTTALAYNDRKVVKGGAINALVDTDIPLMQVGTNGVIAYGDLNNRLPIIQIPYGGYCNPGGVTNDDNLALFGIYGNSNNYNGIYSYGRKENNESRVLNLEYNIGACTEVGAICKVGTAILIAYRYGSNYYVKKVDTDNKATGYYYSLDLKPPASLNYVPVWTTVVLNMKPLPVNCSVEVYYKRDKTGSFIQAKMEDGLSSASTTGLQEAVFLIGDKAKIFELEIKLNPYANTTPEVYSAEVYFE